MPWPGPVALARNVVVPDDDPVPEAWAGCAEVVVNAATVDDPAATAKAVEGLARAWSERRAVVIRLRVDPSIFRAPQEITTEPWRLDVETEPAFDRLHFLVWVNAYDARSGELVWWWATKAARLGADPTPEGPADVTLPDGTPSWIDGGPRQPWAPGEVTGDHDDDIAIVHADTVDAGHLTPQPDPVEPKADLAGDQLAAVAHPGGPARVIAPAGSGKTRVLTERLRHLLADRAYEPSHTMAVAYNVEARREMEARTTDLAPQVRTVNSLGLWVLREHRGSSPQLLGEREVRRLIEQTLDVKPRWRANTDPIGPYVEALGTVRLGLVDPTEVEADRDDVEGLASLFDRYQAALERKGVVDFDEQVYGAIKTLLADGDFRRRMQNRCRHLLVDEFQDLTPAHVLLIRLLALPTLDVFGVGDDDQCIYGHAGADPGFLIDYADLFTGAGDHPLEVNYRCPEPVTSGAATLLGYNHRRVAKTITAGPDVATDQAALEVRPHANDEGAATVVEVIQGWLGDPGVEPASVAVLSRINAGLLAPQVALAEAGVPVASTLRAETLERTGIRAALAYLRIATSPSAINPRDVTEVLRRPSRGLPPWFSDRLGRRSTLTVGKVRSIANQVGDKVAPKVEDLADDLATVVAAANGGTTRAVLEAVRDDIGLERAMNLLDGSGTGQGSSHVDDLDALVSVADLHPDPAGFEAWLRGLLERPADAEGVVLSTIHRVKGREWDRVVVTGVTKGVVPHRLAEDREEERRVLHVAITRCRHRVAVLTDGSRRSAFLDELAGTAPHRPPPGERGGGQGSLAGTDRDRNRGAGGGRRDGDDEAPLDADGQAADTALRDWRKRRAKADGVPAFVVLSDRHLRGIARARPGDERALARCDGIGPTKLERYGDEILAELAGLDR